MDSASVLRDVLSGLGYIVYRDQANITPEKTPASYLIYRKISEKDFVAHGGRIGLDRCRFQITHVSDGLVNREAMVQAVKSALLGNKTNFNAVEATEIHIEDKEADKVFTAVKDYLIWFKE